MAPLFGRMTVIGCGLIGGSLARAAKGRGLAGEVVGAGRRRESLERALALGVVDRFDADRGRACQGADLVVVAIPVRSVPPVVAEILPHLAPGAILTDVGSVKAPLVRAVESLPLGGVRFVGGHPIAGTERAGVEASFAELFEDHFTILTPTERTDREALARVASLWEGVGAKVVEFPPERHDALLAEISHLPHLVAYALVAAVGEGEGLRFAAGGFRDFTRIASSDPVMWRDICLENRDALLAALGRFESTLQEFRAVVEARQAGALEEAFGRAKGLRDEWLRSRGGR